MSRLPDKHLSKVQDVCVCVFSELLHFTNLAIFRGKKMLGA